MALGCSRTAFVGKDKEEREDRQEGREEKEAERKGRNKNKKGSSSRKRGRRSSWQLAAEQQEQQLSTQQQQLSDFACTFACLPGARALAPTKKRALSGSYLAKATRQLSSQF